MTCRTVMRDSVPGLRDHPGPRYRVTALSSESCPDRANEPAMALMTDLLAEAMIESFVGVQPFQYRSATIRPRHSTTTAVDRCVPAQSMAAVRAAVS